MWKLASCYYSLKKICKKPFNKKYWLTKIKGNNYFKITKIKKNKNEIQYFCQIEGKINRYFYPDIMMSITYNENINTVPDGILVIPLLTNILPVIWLNDAKIYVDEIDKNFLKSVAKVRQAYKKMFPKGSFKGKIIAKKVIDYSFKSTDKAITLFSGGVDSFATLISHINEKPELFTIWGSDIDINNEEGWKVVEEFVKKVGKNYNLSNIIVKSSFRKFINTDNLDLDYKNIINDSWWHGVQHGIGLLGHTAIYAYKHKINKVYIPSTYTKKEENIVCASHPTIDNALAFASTTIWHDGFENSRLKKIKLITDYVKKTGNQINLRVCWRSLKGDNCCVCEKCYRTIISIILFGQDPNDYGFNVNDNMYNQIKKNIKTSGFMEKNLLGFWKEIQKSYLKNKNNWKKDKRVNWILDFNFDKLFK